MIRYGIVYENGVIVGAYTANNEGEDVGIEKYNEALKYLKEHPPIPVEDEPDAEDILNILTGETA